MKAGEIPGLLKNEGIIAKKGFSQNFLINEGILKKMVELATTDSNQILEIGPGPALMTLMMAEKIEKIKAIELDENFIRFHKKLELPDNLEIIYADFLKFSLENVFDNDEPWTIIGNIPYGISGLIFRKTFVPHKNLSSIFLLVQDEVGRRLIAKKGKEYGILSVLAWMFGEPKIEFVVSSGSFRPIPKIKSAFISVKRIDRKIEVDEWEKFIKFVKAAFSTRRKTLVNCIKLGYKDIINREDFTKILVEKNIDLNVRAEALSPVELLEIFRNVRKNYHE